MIALSVFEYPCEAFDCNKNMPPLHNEFAEANAYLYKYIYISV